MSQAQLDKLISVIMNDPAMLQQATKGEENLQQCASNFVQYAKAQGYDITEEEAHAWIAQLPAGELKDAELDAVAGGAIYMNPGNEVGLPAVQRKMGDGSVRPIGGYDLKYGLKIEG
jgi:predicted ribosomally synthesized peptide with nif11-like leader